MIFFLGQDARLRHSGRLPGFTGLIGWAKAGIVAPPRI